MPRKTQRRKPRRAKRRRVKKNMGHINHKEIVYNPPKGYNKQFLPPALITTMTYTGQIAYLAADNVGKFASTATFASFTVNANNMYQPLANIGQAGASAPIIVSGSATSASGFEYLCAGGSQYYQKYRVLGGSIKVTVDIASAYDEGILMIAPVLGGFAAGGGAVAGTFSTGTGMLDGARVKQKSMLSTPSNDRDCSLSYNISTAKVFGVTPSAIKTEDNYMAKTVNPPTTPWFWQVGYVCNSATAGGQNFTASVAFTIKLTYRIMFENSDPTLIAL